MSVNKPKIICITGGKGGTGKSMVAVNLATMFKNNGKRVLLIDGDVENPNTYLLLGAELKKLSDVFFFIPKINKDICSMCGLCGEKCLSNALLTVMDLPPIPMLNLCSGCKLCYKICPDDAISEDSKVIGTLYQSKKRDIDILVGELRPSEARSAAVVKGLLNHIDNLISEKKSNPDVIILDTAPGAHCDVEELIQKADYVIPVTEPTRFGLLDLTRIIELINLLGKKYKIIINRSSMPGYKQQFLKEIQKENISILGSISLSKEVVESYCNANPLMEDTEKYASSEAYRSFNQIYEKLIEWSGV